MTEVFKVVCRQNDEGQALQAVAAMRQGTLVPLDDSLALEAGQLSLAYQLPLADSIVLATARRYDAVIWTQDADFEGIEKVRYRPKVT